MDFEQLNIFTNQIKVLIDQDVNKSVIIEQLQTCLKSCNSKIEIYEKSEKEYNSKIQEIEEKYNIEIENLKEQINNLKKENSEKSSKTIWETTQNKIK
jgi:phage host-nuclease inhibitor protein Gam